MGLDAMLEEVRLECHLPHLREDATLERLYLGW